MATATIPVKGMTCEGCVNSVTKALQGVDGVKEAQVELERNQATITFDDSKTSKTALKKAVEEAGYETN
ncbi:copper ion binding protein [Micrococcus luteus]|uniref:heavy-metal-associated domain-containing protein n=1 Tax=Bacillus subtilis TaxID=1423 RepID=UPI001C2356FF|nr:copper ion binding protein [Micrococcus luteus]